MENIELEKYLTIAAVVDCEDVDTLKLLRKILLDKERDGKRGLGRSKGHAGFCQIRTMADWARELGVPKESMRRYLEKGLSIEEIVELRRINYPRR